MTPIIVYNCSLFVSYFNLNSIFSHIRQHCKLFICIMCSASYLYGVVGNGIVYEGIVKTVLFEQYFLPTSLTTAACPVSIIIILDFGHHYSLFLCIVLFSGMVCCVSNECSMYYTFDKSSIHRRRE